MAQQAFWGWAGEFVCVEVVGLLGDTSAADRSEPLAVALVQLLTYSICLQLFRAFRAMDDDGSKALNEEEFITGIRDIGLDVTDDEIKQMFNT